ncbi:MAG: hypothetical protein LBF15_02875 [Candidatus Peribacteria bacterium]|jgi:hypothetical protein|nr:hypothetical protein [Candidatus Peribacteria bacterium]
MDFKTIKEKLVGAGKKAKDEVVSVSKKAKDGVVSGTNKAINFSATKLSKSGATIRDRESLLSAIEKSKNTEFKNEKTGEK